MVHSRRKLREFELFLSRTGIRQLCARYKPFFKTCLHVCACLYVCLYVLLISCLQVAKAVPHLFLSLEREPSEQLVSAFNQTQNPLGTPEHIAIFVVNTLFNAILGATYGAQNVSMKTEVEPEKLIVWFKAYRLVCL